MRKLVFCVSGDGKHIAGHNLFSSNSRPANMTMLFSESNENDLAYLARRSRRNYEHKAQVAEANASNLENLAKKRQKNNQKIIEEIDIMKNTKGLKSGAAGVVTFIAPFAIVTHRLLEMQAKTWTFVLGACLCILVAKFVTKMVKTSLDEKLTKLEKELTLSEGIEAALARRSIEQTNEAAKNYCFAKTERENQWRHVGHIDE